MNQRHESETRISEFDKFREIVARLRGRDGCPWDRAQTMESLKPCMINEMTEAVAGIDLYKATGSWGMYCFRWCCFPRSRRRKDYLRLRM